MKGTAENSSFVEFFKTVLKLKTIHRQGWKDKLDMENPESVADHCYSMTMMAMILADLMKLDSAKIVRMSLLHDLAETITGDLLPGQKTKSEKERLEDNAMKKILKNLNQEQRTSYWNLWREYKKNLSKEAKLLHQIDKLEMAAQASVYEKSGFTRKQTASFFESAKSQITDPTLKKVLSEFL